MADSVRVGDASPQRSTNRRLFIALLAFVCAALLIRAWLLIPTIDDGVIANTILGTPYYSEYHELHVPFYKPLVTVLMPLRFVPYPMSFALAALVHGFLIAGSAYLTYVISRRHMPPRVAVGAGVLALYTLFTLSPLAPMRPEGLLLLTVLTIVYLADTWRLRREPKYLLAAGALTGGLALPMHTNASIAYIFLTLFALYHVRSLTLRDWVWLGSAVATSSVVGLAVLLAPTPSDLPKLLTEYSGEGNRFTFVIGEVRRFTFLLRPAPLLPAVLFFGAIGLGILLRERARIPSEWRGFVQRYATLLMLGVAAFVALGLLPSAEWGNYLVYYIPVLAAFASLAYDHWRPSLRAGLGVGCLVIGAVCIQTTALYLLREEMEAWVLVGLVHGAVAAVLLCLSWLARRLEWLAAPLIVGVVVSLGLMAADYRAYADVGHALRARSAEVGGEMILGPPELTWAFSRHDFHPVEHNWNEVPPAGIGVAATRDRSTDAEWHQSCTFTDVQQISFTTFVSNRFRGGHGQQWELATVECEDP